MSTPVRKSVVFHRTKSVLIDKIDSFRGLKDNWDSYDAPPISEAAIEAAKEFVGRFAVCPASDGGVSFEVRLDNGLEFGVDFGADGRVTGVLAGWDRMEP